MFYFMTSNFETLHISTVLFAGKRILCLVLSAMQCSDDKYLHPKTKNCTDCISGFYGINCTKTCRYPNYGTACQQQCHCAEHQCNAIIGCVATGHESETNNLDLSMIIGLSVGFGIVLMIVAFVVITLINQKFYTRHIQKNAHYIGSVVTEHINTTNNLYIPSEPNTRYCSANEATDSSVYTLASSLRN